MISDFYCPSSIQQVLEIKKEKGEQAIFIAGGTEINSRSDIQPKYLISLERIGLDKIVVEQHQVKIGATTTIQSLIDNNELQQAGFAKLQEAASHLINRQVRNMATVGGNIAANRSCSDMIPVLIAYQATLQVHEQQGPKTISMEEYVTTENKSLILEIIIPIVSDRLVEIANYTRSANDLAVINVAVSLSLQQQVDNVIIAIGGVAKHVCRLANVEKVLCGQSSQNYSHDEIEKAVVQNISPIDDIRGSSWFKKHLAATMIADIIHTCLTKGK